MPALPVAATAIALLAVLPSGPADTSAAVAAPAITVLNVTGTGCRPNTTTAALSLDATALTVTYSQYVIAAGGSTKAVSKNCRINLKIDPVPGYAPRIDSVDYRGYADLAAGSTGQLAATYGFHGAAHLESATLRLTGAVADGWQATDAAADGLVIGKCTGSNVLDIDSTLGLTSTSAGAATDYLAMDSTDGVVPNTFHLTWSPCS
jgi:uncharacterized protein DUF4360